LNLGDTVSPPAGKTPARSGTPGASRASGRIPLLLATVSTLLAVLGIALPERSNLPEPVNVVLIAIDTLRADHVGAYGYGKGTTPVLDRAAREGVLFESCSSQAPWTLPSFASVFTSLYPSQHGAQINKELRNLAVDVPRRLRGFTTLTSLLRAKGLRAEAFVSNPFTGFGIDADFDSFTYHWGGANEVTDAGLAFLEKEGRDPFFLFLHYNDPHDHHKILPAPFTERFTPPRTFALLDGQDTFGYEYAHQHFGFDLYDARVSFADFEIGRVLDRLKSLGLWRTTLVVIISDHGEAFWEHAREHRELGFDPRGYYGIGHGQSLYQDLLNVVLIMGGGVVPNGQRVSGTVRLIDVMPTILDYMHVRTTTHMEGSSLRAAIRSGHADGLPAYSEGIAYGYEKKALRLGRWKYILSSYHHMEELFDLSRDPHEHVNLTESARGQARIMRDRIRPFLRKGGEEAFAAEAQEPIDEELLRRLQSLGYLK
jgi:arylsulfatase A-like enzyme